MPLETPEQKEEGGPRLSLFPSFSIFPTQAAKRTPPRMRKDIPRFLEWILLSTPAVRDPYKEHSTLRGWGAQMGS